MVFRVIRVVVGVDEAHHLAAIFWDDEITAEGVRLLAALRRVVATAAGIDGDFSPAPQAGTVGSSSGCR